MPPHRARFMINAGRMSSALSKFSQKFSSILFFFFHECSNTLFIRGRTAAKLSSTAAAKAAPRTQQQEQQNPHPVKLSWGFYNTTTIMSWCQYTCALKATYINIAQFLIKYHQNGKQLSNKCTDLHRWPCHAWGSSSKPLFSLCTLKLNLEMCPSTKKNYTD